MIVNRLIVFLALFISCLALIAADADTSSKKNNYQHYAITGVQTGVNTASGARPARRNILEMQNDTTTLYALLLALVSDADSRRTSSSLYILSLIAMQSASESDLTSWYQIAGENESTRRENTF